MDINGVNQVEATFGISNLLFCFVSADVSVRDGTRDSGGVTYSLDIGGDRTPVFCDHPVLYYYLE